jgi:hypothetical protein
MPSFVNNILSEFGRNWSGTSRSIIPVIYLKEWKSHKTPHSGWLKSMPRFEATTSENQFRALPTHQPARSSWYWNLIWHNVNSWQRHIALSVAGLLDSAHRLVLRTAHNISETSDTHYPLISINCFLLTQPRKYFLNFQLRTETDSASRTSVHSAY